MSGRIDQTWARRFAEACRYTTRQLDAFSRAWAAAEELPASRRRSSE